MSKKIVVTGASGFIGANLTRRIIAEGHDVYLLLRPNCQTWRLNDILGFVGTRFVQMQDIESLFITLNEIKPDWIFHLASYGAYDWQKDWREMVETNVLSSINLIECASRIGVQALINSGCCSEYGLAAGGAPESQHPDPQNYYGITKSAQTMASRLSVPDRQLYSPTMRLYSAYGPWQSPHHFIPNMILNGLEEKAPPRVEIPGLQDYVYVDDVVDAYLKAAAKPVRESCPIYNVGSGTETSYKDLIEIFQKEFNLKKGKAPAFAKSGTNGVNNPIAADITKIRKNLDWYPSCDMEIGFKKFATWFRENPDFIQLYKIKQSQAGI